LVQDALGELAGAAKEGLLAQQADFEGLFEAMAGFRSRPPAL
jgi:hypothetical protein